ncbi:PREDICTED: serine carboxypeptidase-like 31, partial [Ipomoea nil]|uniref:serine carboxypeptidase-like 31 n=1 Tax=Ipomoea nil TaxID=35883 RepID=UPI00090088F8
ILDIALKMILSFYLLLVPSLLLFEPVAVAARLSQRSNENISDLVTQLPGQPSVGFKHYAGYVTVNESNGRALFYWFYESLTLPEQKPLVLWLNGGPGCSSVGYGATQEIGPFLVDSNGSALTANPYSWNREANLLFLESPIGVGFSYTNTSADYVNLGDDFTANDAYTFLHKWFLKFPSFRTRAFYIAGESYAGKYIPQLAELIVEKNKDPSLSIDLRGVLLGNPLTSNVEDWKGIVDYAWSHAIISDETHNIILKSCDFNSDTWNNDCTQAVDEVYKQYKEIDMYSLYTSLCINDNSSEVVVFKSWSKMVMPRLMGGYDPCVDGYTKSYYNIPDVQKALHAGDGRNLKDWKLCNMTLYNDWTYQLDSVLPIYRKLIAAGLKIWVYSGDTDGRVPVLSTRYSISALGLPITQAWRPWYHNKQVAGWVQEYKGLSFATFRGAGHAVPTFKPSESLAFFSSFISGKSLPSHRNP